MTGSSAVSPCRYKSPGEAYVEGDASSASYFLAGATITGGTITVEGCGSESLQGDVRFAEVMGLLGAEVQWAPYAITITGPAAKGQPLKGIDHDCNDIPDAAMTLAVAALFAEVGWGEGGARKRGGGGRVVGGVVWGGGT